MPNHVTNVVEIKNLTDEQMEIIFPRVVDGEFSFKDVFPMPKELEAETCYYTNNVSLLADFENIQDFLPEKREMILQAKKKYDATGYASWYAFNKDMYGTKWDAYGVHIDNVSMVEENNNTLQMVFQSAWSTPIIFFKNLSERFPNLEINVEYADEDLGANCGTYSFSNGVLKNSYEYPMPSEPYYDNESVEFAGKLIYGDEWEDVKEEYRLSETE